MHQDEKSEYDSIRRQTEQLLQQRWQRRQAEMDISKQVALVANNCRTARMFEQGGNGSEKRQSCVAQEHCCDEWSSPGLSRGSHHAESKAEASGPDDPHAKPIAAITFSICHRMHMGDAPQSPSFTSTPRGRQQH